MSEILMRLLDTSVNASYLIVAVILIRFLLKRAPGWISRLMWGVVGLRLIMLFPIGSALSLVPSAQPVSDAVNSTAATEAELSILSAPSAQGTPYISAEYVSSAQVPFNASFEIVDVLPLIWLVGLVALLIYGLTSYVRLHWRVRPSVRMCDDIYYCDGIDTPFILGIIKPRIYLPSGIAERHIPYVILHERAHLRCGDHIIKPVGFALLAVYWFNPLVWVAYALMCCDLEVTCDRRVIRGGDDDTKRRYSEALVECSAHRRTMLACPPAFGEAAVKGRIKSVLSYKKPMLWIIIVAVVCCVAVVVTLFTVPGSDGGIDMGVAKFLDDQISTHYAAERDNEKFSCINYELFGSEHHEERHTFYLWTMLREYSCDGDTVFVDKTMYELTVITADKIGWNNYRLISYKVPESRYYCCEDNTIYEEKTLRELTETAGDKMGLKDHSQIINWVPDILFYEENFNKNQASELTWDEAADFSTSMSKLTEGCDNSALKYFGVKETGIEWYYDSSTSLLYMHNIHFVFDFEYTHITAQCIGGQLEQDLTAEAVMNNALKSKKYDGKDLTWIPLVGSEQDPAGYFLTCRDEIFFTVYNGDEVLGSGTVSINMLVNDMDLNAIYDVQLNDCLEFEIVPTDDNRIRIAKR